jgi:Protein of unknown function (DUF2628)
MASARDEIGSFGAILGRRLQAARGSGPSIAIERDAPAQPDPDRDALAAICVRSETVAPAGSPPVAEVEPPVDDGRPYARLRAVAQTSAARRLVGLAIGAEGDRAASVLPLDAAKTFVGANATHYDECWRLMEWRRRNYSWNWAAALTLGGWLAYRRLYRYALLHSAWLGLLLLLALKGISILLLAPLQVAVAVALGLYGNALYRQRFRRAAMTAARHEGDHAARLTALAAAGGVDPRAVWIMGLAIAVAAALIVRYAASTGNLSLPS